jgi:hypothetical protein
MSEHQIKLPHSLKQAPLEQFPAGEAAYVPIHAIYADTSERLWLSASTTARAKSNSEFCAKVEKTEVKQPDGEKNGPAQFAFPAVKIDLSACNEQNKYINERAPEKYGWNTYYQQMNSTNWKEPDLPVVKLDGY